MADPLVLADALLNSRPATANPLMLAKALRQQEANPRPALSSLMNYPQTWQQFGDNIQANYPMESPAAVRQAAYQAAMNVGPLATVYHGSPHRFDKFDASKIGTGEGAQAYGHGLYLAESPEVAKSYSALGHIKGNLSTIGGRDINSVYRGIENNAAKLPPKSAAAEYEKLGMLENLMNNQTPSEVRKFAQDNGYSKATLDWFNSQVAPKYQGSGNLYKVDLPDDQIAKMLDWDKPLSQQPKNVQDAFNAFVNSSEGLAMAREYHGYKEGMKLTDLPGFNLGGKQSINGDLIVKLFGGGEYAAQKLKGMGIPGIRYLDGGSRAGGQGTSNFVVFPGNEGALKILSRE